MTSGALEHLPPHDIEAEQSLIAAALVEETVFDRVDGLVAPADFFRPSHEIIWATLKGMRHDHKSLNLVTVTHALAVAGDLEKIGGSVYLSGLINDLPTTIGVEDYAGIVHNAAGLRRLITFAGNLANSAYTSDDFTETAAKAARELGEITANHAGAGWHKLSEVFDNGVLDEYIERFLGDPDRREQRGIPTGLRALDDLLDGGGLLPGKLYTIGAATSMGKSSVLRWLMKELAKRGHRCAIFSLEQDEATVGRELITAEAGINRSYYERNHLPVSDEDVARVMEATGTLYHLPIHVNDEPALSPAAVRGQLLALKAKYPDLEIVIIDYLHILQADSTPQRGQSGADMLTEMVRTIRDTCRRMGLACLLASQLNRDVGDNARNKDLKPKMEHLRGSGGIEFLSYGVLYLFREDYYIARGKMDIPPGTPTVLENGKEVAMPTNNLEIGILKQQLGPAGVSCTVKFDPITRRMWEES